MMLTVKNLDRSVLIKIAHNGDHIRQIAEGINGFGVEGGLFHGEDVCTNIGSKSIFEINRNCMGHLMTVTLNEFVIMPDA